MVTIKLKFSDFDQDGIADNISFMIKRIKVHTTDALKDPGYRFPGNYGVEKFLELFSGKALIRNAQLNFLKSVCEGGLFLFLGI